MNAFRKVVIHLTVAEGLVPPELKRFSSGKVKERSVVDRQSGLDLIEKPIQGVGLERILGEMDSPREFSAASYERIPDPSDRTKIYHVPSYEFTLREFADMDDKFRVVCPLLFAEFRLRLCKSVAYIVRRACSNPSYGKDGKEIQGYRSLDINLNGRQTLLQPDGQPIMVWPGKRGEGEKVPQEPRFQMTIQNGVFEII